MKGILYCILIMCIVPNFGPSLVAKQLQQGCDTKTVLPADSNVQDRTFTWHSQMRPYHPNSMSQKENPTNFTSAINHRRSGGHLWIIPERLTHVFLIKLKMKVVHGLKICFYTCFYTTLRRLMIVFAPKLNGKDSNSILW